jgi:hypothetical protein
VEQFEQFEVSLKPAVCAAFGFRESSNGHLKHLSFLVSAQSTGAGRATISGTTSADDSSRRRAKQPARARVKNPGDLFLLNSV